MSKQLPTPVIQQTSIDAVNRYHRAAKNSAAQMAVYAVLAGLELAKIKEALPHGTFTEFVERQLEINERTAQRYIRLADGVKNKALKTDTVSVLALLDSAPSDLTPAKAEQLQKLVHKVTDGAGVSQLYQEFGIAKVPQGSATTGGGPGGRKPGAVLSLPEQEEALRTHAREQWALIDRGFFGYEDKFTLLGRVEVEAQIALLEIQLAARKKFLAGAKPADVTKALKV